MTTLTKRAMISKVILNHIAELQAEIYCLKLRNKALQDENRRLMEQDTRSQLADILEQEFLIPSEPILDDFGSDEQPSPVANNHPAIVDLVIIDMLKRKQLGIERYGVPLQAFNGRDALMDAYGESMDQTLYLKQVIEERNSGKKA